MKKDGEWGFLLRLRTCQVHIVAYFDWKHDHHENSAKDDFQFLKYCDLPG